MNRRTFMTQSAGTLAAVALMPDLAAARLASGEQLGVAIVGLGRQGRSIIAELQTFEQARIAAICDTDERRLASGGRRAPDAAQFATIDELLAKGEGVDAVIVATPTHLHRAVVEPALAAGKHVYCEAPISNTPDDARAIVRAARASDRVVQAGFLARSDPVYTLARSFFRSDSVRDPVLLRAQHHDKTSWRTPASDPAREKALNWRLDPDLSLGLAGEWGSHQFDVMHYFLSAFPTSVTGTGAIRFYDDGRTVPDTITCTLGFDGGLPMLYDATLANSFAGRYEVLHGTNAAIKLAWSHGWMFKEADAPTQGWEVYANRQQFFNDEGITLIAGATKLAEQGKLKEGVGLPHSALWYGLEAFLKSVLEGENVTCSIEDGFRSTAVGIAAAQAVNTGEHIAITEEMLRA